MISLLEFADFEKLNLETIPSYHCVTFQTFTRCKFDYEKSVSI